MEAKNLAPLRILEILRNYSSVEHKLTQAVILDYLWKNYGIDLERKSISRHINNLVEAGFNIQSTPKGVYLVEDKPFKVVDVYYLINMVLYSKDICAIDADNIIKKLVSLNNDVKVLLDTIKKPYQVERTKANSLFENLTFLTKAILRNKTISFSLIYYDEYKNKKKSQKYIVVPKNIEVLAGINYLFASDGFKYEIFKMVDLTYEEDEIINNQANEDKANIRLKLKKEDLNLFIDEFGLAYNMIEGLEYYYIVEVYTGIDKVIKFAKIHNAIILMPIDVVHKMKNEYNEMNFLYNNLLFSNVNSGTLQMKY